MHSASQFLKEGSLVSTFKLQTMRLYSPSSVSFALKGLQGQVSNNIYYKTSS